MIIDEIRALLDERKKKKLAREKIPIVKCMAWIQGWVPCRYAEVLRRHGMNPSDNPEGFYRHDHGQFDVFLAPEARTDGLCVAIFMPGPFSQFELVPWEEITPERISLAIEINKAMLEKRALEHQSLTSHIFN